MKYVISLVLGASTYLIVSALIKTLFLNRNASARSCFFAIVELGIVISLVYWFFGELSLWSFAAGFLATLIVWVYTGRFSEKT
jgi:hypothetical protein